jgi:hypothetical protein
VKRLILLLLLAAGTAAASPCETLEPLFVRPLPLPTFRRLGGVAWRDDRRLLIGAESGVNEYDLEGGGVKRVVSASAIPYGLPAVTNLASDGQRLFAFNLDYSDLAFDLASSRILQARRHAALQIMDVAVRGDTLAVLGRPIMLKADFGALWVGRIGAPWEEFRGFRPLQGEAVTIYKGAIAPYGGAVVIQKNGTVAMVTPAEAGVRRFAADGTQFPTLGAELTQLVVPRLPEAIRKYNIDERGRYEQIFNRQPTIDDLLDTSDDLAVVVRRIADGRVTWDLWFPDAKTTRRIVHLGLSDTAEGGGHLHCDTRGPRIACLFGKTTGFGKPDVPHIALFDLRQARACPAAHAAVEGWTWSDDCAPHREGESCPATVRYSVRVKAGTDVRWGTEPMLAEIADGLLPVAQADANGVATFEAPKGERVLARAAGPALASAWTAMPDAITAGEAAKVAMLVDPPHGAHIELRSLDAAGLPFRGAGDGAVEIPPVPSGSMRAVVWSDEGAPAVINALPGELPRTVMLTKGVTLRGVTVTEESAAIKDAAITASFVIPRERITIRKRAASDGRGAFAIGGLALGDIAWSAAKEPLAQRAEVIRADDDIDLGPVILPKAREVRVLVTDEQARPVANAIVRAEAARSARTNDRGMATLPGVPAAQFRLRVTAKGYLPFDETREGDAKVRLAKAAAVRARIVREEDGAPAGPGTASLEINGRKSIEEFDASGSLELDGLDAGRLNVEVRPDGFAPFRVPERRIAKGEDVDLGAIRVSRGFGIAGRAVDAAGAPLPNVLLRVLRPGAFMPALAYLRGEWASAQSAADGAFRIGGLAPGVYTLWSEAAGRAPLVKTGITVGENSDLDLGDVKIGEVHALRIRCEPAAQCGSEASVGIDGVDWLPLAAPLANGNATIAPLPAGPAVLRLTERGGVVHEREVTISATERTTEVAIAMHGVTVTGRVTRGGRAVGEGLVRLSTTEQQPFIQLAQATPMGTIGNEIIGVVPRVVSASVGGDGAFELRDVAPGRYAATWLSDTTQSAPRTIVIPEAQAFALALELPESGVSGIVRKRDGSAPRQAMVTVEQGARRINILADSGGNFSFVGLEAGAATVRASGEGLVAEEKVTVDEGRSAFAQLTLDTKRVNDVAVLVTSEQGPQANVFVFLRQSGQLQASTTGADGRAVFHLAPSASTAEVTAWSPAYGWMFVAPRQLGDELAEVAITMRRTAAGLLVDGKGAIGVWSPSGFPLHEALQLLGVRSAAPLRIDGLPAGTYGITSANARKDVAVTDRVAEVRF